MKEKLFSPQETYERLLDGANDSRKKRSLESLNEVCRLICQKNSSDYSYKTIVALGKDRGLPVPSEKSIVNPSGASYRELINSWKVEANPKVKVKSGANDWINQIEDPVIRLSVNLLANELRAVKAKMSRQERAAGHIYLGSVLEQTNTALAQPHFLDVEITALKAAIDPNIISLVGLSIGKRGEILDVKGRVVHKPGFRDAIEKILSLQALR